jgi:PBP1b-binding outer membrane lipoprotein LpoB
MKNIVLIAFSLLVTVSCSTQKVLKTDTQGEIDLSGRWNNTDAEIATNQLFNNLMTSSWFKVYQSESTRKVRIAVNEFESNFNRSESSMQDFFSKYAEDSQLVELIDKDSDLKSEFQIGGTINAEEFINQNQKYIDYILTAQLTDLEGQVLWEENTVVKKYISN